MEYKLCVVRVFVTDWTRAIDFYTNTLGMTPVFVGDGWAEFATGEAHLALEHADPADEEHIDLVGRFVGVSLQVDDIYSRFAALTKHGVEFVGAPQKQPWGGVLAHFRDPDGNVLTLLGG